MGKTSSPRRHVECSDFGAHDSDTVLVAAACCSSGRDGFRDESS